MKKYTKSWLIPISLLLLFLCVVWFFNHQASAPGAVIKSNPETSTAHSNSASSFNRAKYSLTDPTSIWVVVNKQNPLTPFDYAPKDLVAVGGGQYMRREAATAMTKLFTVAKSHNIYLSAASGYRSYQTQIAVYNREVKINGQRVADSESARPGYSEHQTGLAVDVAGNGCIINDCFAKTKAGQWVANNAYLFGFVVRYSANKANITGYRFEPWHIRYVGIELATSMHQQKIETLEEFFGLKPAPNY